MKWSAVKSGYEMNDDFIKHLKNEKWRIVAEKKASIKKRMPPLPVSCLLPTAEML